MLSAVVCVRRVVRADGSDVCVRYRRQLPVRTDPTSRPIPQDLGHQVPPHGPRCRRSRVPLAGRRRHHAARVL